MMLTAVPSQRPSARRRQASSPEHSMSMTVARVPARQAFNAHVVRGAVSADWSVGRETERTDLVENGSQSLSRSIHAEGRSAQWGTRWSAFRWSGSGSESWYCHDGLGTATTVGALPLRSGSSYGRSRCSGWRGAALARRSCGRSRRRSRGWRYMSGHGSAFEPRPLAPPQTPTQAPTPTPTPTRQQSAAPAQAATPTVGRPRPLLQCPDRSGSAKTVVAVPRLRPRPRPPRVRPSAASPQAAPPRC